MERILTMIWIWDKRWPHGGKDMIKMICQEIVLDFTEWTKSGRAYQLIKGMDREDAWKWYEVSHTGGMIHYNSIPVCKHCWGPVLPNWKQCLWFRHSVAPENRIIPPWVATEKLNLGGKTGKFLISGKRYKHIKMFH